MTADGGQISPLLLDGEVPEGWVRKRLEDVARISGGTTPSRSNQSYWGGETAWATPTDLTARRDGQLSIRETDERITEAALDNTSVRVLPPNSVLMTSRATIGEVAVNAVPMATNQGFCNFQPKDDLDSEFLAYWLSGNKQRLERLAGGSTFLELAKRDARQVRIHLPALLEQKKIAAVLSSVDNVIAVTREVIEQTKRVKKGLLQDLMTRGIGHTRFKKTAIGKIPEEWEVCTVGELAALGRASLQTGPFGTELKAEEYAETGVPLISVGEIKQGRVQIREETPRIGPEVISRLPEYVLEEGDIVFARKGGVDRSALITRRESGWFLGSDGIRLQIRDEILPAFVALYLQRSRVQRWLEANATGSTMPSLSQKVLRRLQLPVPGSSEQKQIAESLEALDPPIGAAKRQLESLSHLKRGLMQDLLTGRVRVPVD